MSIRISKPGILATLQDLGRAGYRSAGIGPGGAMDRYAATVANFLAGNEAAPPVIEMHFPAPEIVFEEDMLISITGADFEATLDGVPLSLWRPLRVKPQTKLAFGKYKHGARAYLAIQGKWEADRWLNSYSTHLALQVGGLEGRALKKADRISVVGEISPACVTDFPDLLPYILPVYNAAGRFRCIPGPEWDWLNEESQAIFSTAAFSVSPQSNRMAYRLLGKQVTLQIPQELVSSPVDAGTIQRLPNGQLIILMADHQTTGGYPRIASVIGADLPRLSQVNLNNDIQFQWVNIGEAEAAAYSMEQNLETVKQECKNYYGKH